MPRQSVLSGCMAGGTRIVAIGNNGTDAAPDAVQHTQTADAALTLDQSWAEDGWDTADEETSPSSRREWLAPTLAGCAIFGWTGFFIWTNLAAMRADATPAQWAGWISAWSRKSTNRLDPSKR